MSRFKTPLYLKGIDVYLRAPIFFDTMLAILVSGTFLYAENCHKIQLAKEDVYFDILSDLMSTSISLAGFILAALTIIVTFKDSVSSVSARPNAKALFFGSKHYFSSVKTFFRASILLLAIFFVLACLKLSGGGLPDVVYKPIIISSIILISLAVLRSLYLLLGIIKIQHKAENG